MVKPVAILLIGHQYSGKSTWLADRKDGYEIYSLDNEVHALAKERDVSYAEAWKSLVKEANKIADAKLVEWVVEKRNIIFDRTNMTEKSRDRVLRFLTRDYEKEAIVFPLLPDEQILERIAKRPTQYIPLHVVQEFRDRYEPVNDNDYRKVHYL